MKSGEEIKLDEHFILQEHKNSKLWPYKYRILMRENRMEIANSNDLSEIEYDFLYLEKHAVPQLDQKKDWINDINLLEIVTKMIEVKRGK